MTLRVYYTETGDAAGLWRFVPEEKRRGRPPSGRAAAYALLAWALRERGGLAGLRFAPGGKPYIPGGTEFSISHTATHALCAVGAWPVGADVETVRPVAEGMTRRVLSSEELDALPAGGEERRFFTLWTLKESYIKLRGAPLSMRSLSFTVDGARARLRGSDARFRVYDCIPGCLAAVAAEAGEPPEPEHVPLSWLSGDSGYRENVAK